MAGMKLNPHYMVRLKDKLREKRLEYARVRSGELWVSPEQRNAFPQEIEELEEQIEFAYEQHRRWLEDNKKEK